jgi:hypothetical protein
MAAASTTAQTGNIYTAILTAAVNFGTLEKDAENPFFKSKYLSLSGLLQAIRPALSDEGILIQSAYKIVGTGFIVETSLLHLPSQTSIKSEFPVTDLNPQKVGAAGTFGMRYNLLQLLAIAPEDDDGSSLSDLKPGQATPDQFLGPNPTGSQRTQPAYQPAPGATVGPAWLQPGGQQAAPQYAPPAEPQPY